MNLLRRNQAERSEGIIEKVREGLKKSVDFLATKSSSKPNPGLALSQGSFNAKVGAAVSN